MKIQDRSDELCRENERLHNQLGELNKELEVEKGKVKNKIRELMEERDKNKRLDAQLVGKMVFSLDGYIGLRLSVRLMNT